MAVTTKQGGVSRVVSRRGQWQIYLSLPPVPAARPKVGRWGAYYPKRYADWKSAAHGLLTVPEFEPVIYTGPLFAGVYSVCRRPKKLTVPLPRGDVDNFSKAACDAITKAKIIWHDDQQVECLISGKRYANDGEEPHTYMAISPEVDDIVIDMLYGAHKIGD